MPPELRGALRRVFGPGTAGRDLVRLATEGLCVALLGQPPVSGPWVAAVRLGALSLLALARAVELAKVSPPALRETDPTGAKRRPPARPATGVNPRMHLILPLRAAEQLGEVAKLARVTPTEAARRLLMAVLEVSS
jgi:hypothetical protein